MYRLAFRATVTLHACISVCTPCPGKKEATIF